MRGFLLLIGVLAGATLSGLAAATAQDAKDSLSIELNKVEQKESGCRMSFIAVNQLPARLEKTALEIVVFDRNSIVSQMLVLDFGRLPSGKTKVVEFELPYKCDTISRVLVNGVSECVGVGDQDMAEVCLNALRTGNRAQIEFGV